MTRDSSKVFGFDKVPLLRPTVTWLLVSLMPFQVLTAVYLDVRGPAHFHVEVDGHGHDRAGAHIAARGHDGGPVYTHGHEHHDGDDHHHVRDHGHSHGAHHIQRHHHDGADPTVVTVQDDDGLLELFALKEETSGWSGVMLVALVADCVLLQPKSPGGLTPGPEPLLQTRFPAPLERPPRNTPV